MSKATFVVTRSSITQNGNQFCVARKLDAEGNPSASSVGFFLAVPVGQMYIAPEGLALVVTGEIGEVRKAEKAEHLDHVLFKGGVSIAFGEPIASGTAMVTAAPEDALATVEAKAPESLAD